MAVTRKKRRLETEPQAQAAAAAPAMSAFALRRKLLQRTEAVAEAQALAPAPAALIGEVAGGSSPEDGSPASSAEKEKKKEKEKMQATVQADRDTEVEAVSGVVSAAEAAEDTNAAATATVSATVADVSSLSPVVRTARREAPVQRSTFRPTKSNCQRRADGSMRLKLAEGERLVILGSYGIVVGSGEVTVAGATLRAGRRTSWVHAPQCHALPVVRCTDDAAVTLTPHPGAAGLRGLERLAPVFGQLWNETGLSEETFEILYTPEDGTTRSQGLVSPPEWNKLMAELVAASKRASGRRSGGSGVYFVCGPKGSGKSTFSRLLANRLLTEDGSAGSGVAVLDIDPGQPEFSTPGTVSLVRMSEPNLSPPFCHPYVVGCGDGGLSDGSIGSTGSTGSTGPTGSSGARRLRAHDLAAASLASDPEHYIECVLDLYSVYQRSCRRCPLVVNTPGWVLGTGLDVLAELLRRMRPSRVIYMSQDGPDETMQGLRAAYADVPLVSLPSQPSEYTSRTALHLRAMQTMSYLHLDLEKKRREAGGEASAGTLSWDPTPLTAMRPWMVPYAAGPESGILGVLCYDYQPGPELLADAINGTVVSIVAVESAAAFRLDIAAESSSSDSSSGPLPVAIARSPEGLPCIINADSACLDPLHSYAVGVALIRGIDTASQALQLLTPVDAATAVAEVLRQDGLGVVLVSGKQDAPTWAYTEELYRRRAGGGEAERENAADEMPWVEVLHGNEKRAVGSQVWRVRRDLGRNNGGD